MLTQERGPIDDWGHGVADLDLVTLGSPWNSQPLDREGRFSFTVEVAGTYSVGIRSPLGTAERAKFKVSIGAEGPALRIVLRPAATLLGHLVDVDGIPVVGASVELKTHRPGAVDRAAMAEEPVTTATDAEGRFTASGLGGGRYRMRVKHRDFKPLDQSVEIEEGIDREIYFTLGARRDRQALRVTGRVVDTEEAAVDGAEVRLVEGWPNQARTLSLGNGGFDLEAPDAGTYEVQVRHPDFATGRSRAFELGKSPVENLVIELRTGGAVSGRILGLDSHQLAQIYLVAQAGPDRRHGQVSADGTYRITHLGPGEWRIKAVLRASGRSVTESVSLVGEGSVGEIDLQFQRGHRVSGLALCDGQPCRRATAQLYCFPSQLNVYTAVTGDGRFRFEGAPTGSCRVMVTKGAYGSVTAWRKLEVADEAVEVVIEIATGEISGQVLAADSRVPIPGAQIELRGPAHRMSLSPAWWIEADSLGRFSFPTVSSGEWRLRATAEGFDIAESLVESVPKDVQMLLKGAVPGVVYILDASGEAPAEVMISIVESSGRVFGAGRYRPAADGRLVIPSLGPGTWRLKVRVPSGGHISSVEMILPGEPVRVVLQK